MAFRRIMEQAEVDAGVARLSSGTKGRSFSLRSFHSLRHSFIQRSLIQGFPANCGAG
jgi:hypothetical protein